MRVLIIDDDPIIRELAARILERAFHTVQSADSGEKGIALFRAAVGSFDVVVLDMKLGDMSGLECMDVLAEFRHDIPMIVSSGREVEPGEFPRALRGQISILPKPYRSAELRGMVDRLAADIS